MTARRPRVPVVPRIVAEDPWTRIVEIDETTTEIPQDLVEGLANVGMNGLRKVIASYEDQFPALRDQGARQRLLQRPALDYEYRAAQVLVWGRKLLAIGERDPALEPSMTLALSVGGMIADAQWRFSERGTEARSGRKRRRQLRESGQRSGQSRRGEGQTEKSRAIATRLDAIKKEARTARDKHPYERTTYSTRWLAAEVARRLRMKPVTVRRRLRDLKLR